MSGHVRPGLVSIHHTRLSYTRNMLLCLWSMLVNPSHVVLKECKQRGFLRYRGSVGGVHRDALSSSQPIHIIVGRRSSLTVSCIMDYCAINVRPSIYRCPYPACVNLPSPVNVGVFNAQSIGNKYVTICNRITTVKLTLCEIVET